MRPYRSLAAGAARAGRVPALVLATLVLTLLSGLPACSGASEDGAPLGAAETSAPTAGSVEPPTPATSEPAPETLQPPGTPPDPPLSGPPADPDEPGPPTAAPPTDESTATASEEAPTPVAETHILSYDTFDRSGAVAAAGHYAFLEDPDDTSTAVTTYEELRDGTTTGLLVHQHDGYGASQAALYDTVESGDLVEWRQAADCFVRYQVTAVQPDPTGTVPQKLLGVAWMTYAFTGCSGTVATTTAATLDWSALPILGGESLTMPVRHGIYQIMPGGWTGVTEEHEVLEPPLDQQGDEVTPPTESLVEAKRMRHWRAPRLPEGWSFLSASCCGEDTPWGYRALYQSPSGGIGLIIKGTYASGRKFPQETSWRPNPGHADLGVVETRVIAGRPALVQYSPLGPGHMPYLAPVIWIYDPATDTQYHLRGQHNDLAGVNMDVLFDLTASLFESPNAP